MFPLAKNALGRFPVRSIQQMVTRQSHQKRTPDFHDKYGNAILVGGVTFCIAAWTYTATQIGIEWNLSPVGRVTPKEWRDQ
ncbi:cytochrome c oxidase subunit 7B, mitochondrial [Octodon degus]|uniref:Cytochrome c oxidase subunit 7B, mitochondrial n=1 Tax=Octodon degus TaxID=10160 RepID=A0A6P3F525_OCTDE|nr:cytochrome c oxidase subunit 7B, mitochondrial [Octodon degus]XP_004634782.1 cytochrome c oxidase subunit 7B, mitochondrial [Octodon degus]